MRVEVEDPRAGTLVRRDENSHTAKNEEAVERLGRDRGAVVYEDFRKLILPGGGVTLAVEVLG